METECSWQYSQLSAICPCPDPENPVHEQHFLPFLKFHFNINLPLTFYYREDSKWEVFLNQELVKIFRLNKNKCSTKWAILNEDKLRGLYRRATGYDYAIKEGRVL